MCIEISRTYTTRKDKIVYSVFEHLDNGTLVSPFARAELNTGLQTAGKSRGEWLSGCQIGFHRFTTIKNAKRYARIFERWGFGFIKIRGALVVKSIVPAGTEISEGKISGVHTCGSGIPAVLVQTIIQTDEVVGIRRNANIK